jgi:hypothetical protein
MGRVERAAWGAGAQFLVFLIACIPFLWPIMFLPKSSGWGVAWGVQFGWGAVLIVAYVMWYRRDKARRLQRAQAQAGYEYQLAEHRAYMARTNQPWLDAAAGHYRHGTCTIKHRSAGAAGRCSSTI